MCHKKTKQNKSKNKNKNKNNTVKRLTREESNRQTMLKVMLHGTLDYENEIIVGPRKPPKSHKIEDRGWGGYIYTPLKMHGTNKTVIINRGWVPTKNVGGNIDNAKYDTNEPYNPITFQGILKPLLPKVVT